MRSLVFTFAVCLLTSTQSSFAQETRARGLHLIADSFTLPKPPPLPPFVEGYLNGKAADLTAFPDRVKNCVNTNNTNSSNVLGTSPSLEQLLLDPEKLPLDSCIRLISSSECEIMTKLGYLEP